MTPLFRSHLILSILQNEVLVDSALSHISKSPRLKLAQNIFREPPN